MAATLSVDRVGAWVDLAGEPARIVRGHITAHLTGEGDTPERVSRSAREHGTIANSLQAALPIVR